MLQHLLVILVFVLCLFFVVRRLVRFMFRAKRNEVGCNTCTEQSCPLRNVGKKQCCCEDLR